MENTLPELWPKIAIAILIGFLIGLEREKKKKSSEKYFAGIRTFPLISLLGFLSAFISSFTSVTIYVAFILLFGLLISISYYFSAKEGELGGTTEISFLIIFILGSLVFWDYLLLSAAVAVVLMIFLSLKSHFRAFAGRIEDEDIKATIKFAIITIIILPLLPNETFGPFDVLNPRKIWYFVVLIAGISFVGYALFKILGTKKGIQVLSILGGIASSTAVTLSFTERSKEAESLSRNFAAGIILASTIMFPRVLFIIFVLNKSLAEALLIPISIFTVVGVIVSLILWRKTKSYDVKKIELINPFKAMFAVKFGFIFAVVLFASGAAQNYFGDQGIYFTSFIGGLADVDAVALSMVDLIDRAVTFEVASIAVILGATSNSIIKAIISSFFGSKELRKYSLIGFSTIIITAVIYLLVIFL